ncbi:MAG TPA: hypothetical protein VEK34_06790, partial [Methylocella sp.]|nr:hypothetical protein [Methylocella sp.]
AGMHRRAAQPPPSLNQVDESMKAILLPSHAVHAQESRVGEKKTSFLLLAKMFKPDSDRPAARSLQIFLFRFIQFQM